jgi:hypothetical protein
MKTDLKCEMQNADFGMNRISTLHSAIPIPNLKKGGEFNEPMEMLKLWLHL